MTMDNNLERYSDPTVVDHYEKVAGLQPCEEVVFDHWLKPGMAILDIGVGGGRTTPKLSQLSSRYVGIDYSEGMVTACKRRFPHLEFRHGDATNLGEFRDGEFDAVVFSFNGIDCIPEVAARARALREAARVLRPGGVFIISTLNARCLAVFPQMSGARGAEIPWRILYSLYATIRLAARVLPGATYWRGRGYVRDPVHGGLIHYNTTRRHMTAQLKAAGFEVVEIVGGPRPGLGSFLTPWYYYACRKVDH